MRLRHFPPPFTVLFCLAVTCAGGGCARPVALPSPATPAAASASPAPAEAQALARDHVPEMALHDELDEMAAEDQALRMRGVATRFQDPAVVAAIEAVDRRMGARMKVILEQGWPGVSRVGKAGSHKAWLLVQHADHDVALQQRALALLAEAVGRGDASGADLAYLTDRMRVNEGRPQSYGTQFHEVDGVQVPRPIEDPEHVDERRAKVGLGTMEEYARSMERMYGKPARAR